MLPFVLRLLNTVLESPTLAEKQLSPIIKITSAHEPDLLL
jgi:hypothetical protein